MTVLAGGVGAARFLDGLVQLVAPERVTAVVNVGDDVELHGLHVSPDLDTILYTLAGVVNEKQGWGRAEESANALSVVEALSGASWFFLGDKDIGLHLVRTERLRRGEPLSAVTADLCERLGIGSRLVPATDQRVTTMLTTDGGEIDFQTYFVRNRCRDEVRAIRFAGAETARPAPGVLDAIAAADVVVVAPSNPYLSIDPILAVPTVSDALTTRSGPVVAVSPIIGGRAVKGPADRLLRAFAGEASPYAVASHYAGFLTHMLLDAVDAETRPRIEALGVRTAAGGTLMSDRAARAQVARQALELALDEPSR